MTNLAGLDVLVLDCQATAAGPKGHLLELGWARLGREVQARLIKLPPSARIPPAVTRITGLSESMVASGVEPRHAWRALMKSAAELGQPTPTVIHFAQFERPFLEALAGGAPPLDVVCTHEVAKRLFPDLPRRSLRALSGYFGRAVATLRRSADHVEATAFVWRELTGLLDAQGVTTWESLRAWLAMPAVARGRKRGWPMPRDVRLALPDAPGLYRMLRTSGDVLYVGKASSLHHRVNSYFRKQRGIHERTLEMLSQARGLSFVETESALEAALLEPDEIKRHRPPYNVALTAEAHGLWFSSPDFSARSTRPTAECSLGPFPSEEPLQEVVALACGTPGALGRSRWAPPEELVEGARARLFGTHAELQRTDVSVASRLLRLGHRLWREGRRERVEDEEATAAREAPTWTPELAFASLEWVAIRTALALRRASWLTRLVDATLVWSEPKRTGARLLVIDDGEVAVRAAVDAGAEPPHPPGAGRSAPRRQLGFTVSRFDRLKVLTTELKRLVAEPSPLSLRLGAGPPLERAQLSRVLDWV